ncbi:MAG: VacJ family lipoprotein [Rhodospirillaceae bacterium]|jgi:phospholipid-binding lipoprotein MlaA|nr:VacJ family lipoprotein [Rhodospirillaceae bacterium]MBT4587669.1 VacJ family lipoprotein [Rhodospirillaceae bacterium]MBT4939880.1 VacJ family lipoprotein [Rhodospirillaceae bacterium]MBT5938991.1 VacJ family lipoprotein [Rhodospirillaceae bacterium]MBT7266710.1 VacJ family lipoprotein [Rhodospirillaceae bacterium]
MNKKIKITWDFRKWILAAIAPVFAVVIATSLGVSPANAATTIYNMDRMLNEQHPFAQTQPRAPAVAPVVQPRQAPTPSAPDREDNDLDLDDLGPPEVEEVDINDPIEPVNRIIFGFNEILVKYLVGPLARGYNAVLPGPAREAIRNFLSNLNGPVVLANDLLQGEFKRGYDTSMRLVINSTAGVLGFIDVAEKLGYAKHREDFGQTLAVWGIGEGFYLVLPIFGPSNPRDAFGKLVVDPYFDPLGYYLDNTDREEIGYALTGARGFTGYAAFVDQIDELRENSLDFYGALRSLYRQRRNDEIKNGRSNEMPNIDPGLEKRSILPNSLKP